jgi:hypothetical protein
VIACYILNPNCAIIEFENEKFVQKLLDQSVLCLHEVNLSLTKVPETIENKSDEITISPTVTQQNSEPISM